MGFFPVVGGVTVGLFPCGKGGGTYVKFALISSINVELWRYGSVICEMYININFREYLLVNGLQNLHGMDTIS